MVFLAIIASMVIYTLMLSDVNNKTFEFGMLRALGFSTKNIAITIFAQAFFIASPAVCAGLAMAAVLNMICRFVLFTITQNYTDYNLTTDSIIIGVVFGMTVPMIANIMPIRKAFESNLRASLDVYHRQAGEMTIIFNKVAMMGLSLPQTMFAICLIVFGVLSFYGVPIAFITNDLEMFFMIMAAILLLMIMGMMLLVQMI